MATTYDILCFLEYFADRTSVLDGSGNRTPTKQWQNFYPEAQLLSADSDATGEYKYLAFDIEGFGSTLASELNDLTVEMAATAELIDITDTAIGADNLIVASLYIQDAGEDAFDSSSAQLISRYIGSIAAAEVSDESISWTVNPAIDTLKAQVPTKKVAPGMLMRSYHAIPTNV